MEHWLTRPDGLATHLRRLRRASRLTGTSMAATLEWTQSKVSKIENGKQLPTADEITAWAEACGSADSTADLLDSLAEAQSIHREWKQRTRLGQVAIQRDHDELARQARVIRNCELTVVPGLLQTPEYALARITENVHLHGSSQTEVPAAAAERLRRQEVLYDPSKRFEFVITEAVLRLLLCSPSAMLAQLDRLMALTSGMPNLTLGIIPFGVPLTVTPQNRFVLFDDLAVVETHAGETVHEGDEATVYADVMDALLAEACTGDAARQLIMQAGDTLRQSLPAPTSPR